MLVQIRTQQKPNVRISIFLSNLPGLSRAGSNTSGLFVAMIIFTLPSSSNPSI